MKDLVVAVLMVGGALLSFLAAVGILRMPDLFTRMQAATKSGTMGVGLIIAAVAMDAAEIGHGASAILVIAFQLLTAPVAAHMIARAAYFTGVRLWEGTIQDELREQYDLQTHMLGRPVQDSGTSVPPQTNETLESTESTGKSP